MIAAGRTILVSAGPEVDGLPSAAAVAVAAARQARTAATLLDLRGTRAWRSGVLAAEPARRRAALLGSRAGELEAVARGHLTVAMPRDDGPVSDPSALIELIEPTEGPLIAYVDPGELQLLVGERRDSAVLIQAQGGADRALCALVAISLRERGVALKIWTRRPGAIQSHRALAGLDPGGVTSARATRTAAFLLAAGRRR